MVLSLRCMTRLTLQLTPQCSLLTAMDGKIYLDEEFQTMYGFNVQNLKSPAHFVLSGDILYTESENPLNFGFGKIVIYGKKFQQLTGARVQPVNSAEDLEKILKSVIGSRSTIYVTKLDPNRKWSHRIESVKTKFLLRLARNAEWNCSDFYALEECYANQGDDITSRMIRPPLLLTMCDIYQDFAPEKLPKEDYSSGIGFGRKGFPSIPKWTQAGGTTWTYVARGSRIFFILMNTDRSDVEHIVRFKSGQVENVIHQSWFYEQRLLCVRLCKGQGMIWPGNLISFHVDDVSGTVCYHGFTLVGSQINFQVVMSKADEELEQVEHESICMYNRSPFNKLPHIDQTMIKSFNNVLDQMFEMFYNRRYPWQSQALQLIVKVYIDFLKGSTITFGPRFDCHKMAQVLEGFLNILPHSLFLGTVWEDSLPFSIHTIRVAHPLGMEYSLHDPLANEVIEYMQKTKYKAIRTSNRLGRNELNMSVVPQKEDFDYVKNNAPGYNFLSSYPKHRLTLETFQGELRLLSVECLPVGTPVIEAKGNLLSRSQLISEYRDCTEFGNVYSLGRVKVDGIIQMIYLDFNRCGSAVALVRHSPYPTCELLPCVHENVLRLFLVTKVEVLPGKELTLDLSRILAMRSSNQKILMERKCFICHIVLQQITTENASLRQSSSVRELDESDESLNDDTEDTLNGAEEFIIRGSIPYSWPDVVDVLGVTQVPPVNDPLRAHTKHAGKINLTAAEKRVELREVNEILFGKSMPTDEIDPPSPTRQLNPLDAGRVEVCFKRFAAGEVSSARKKQGEGSKLHRQSSEQNVELQAPPAPSLTTRGREKLLGSLKEADPDRRVSQLPQVNRATAKRKRNRSPPSPPPSILKFDHFENVNHRINQPAPLPTEGTNVEQDLRYSSTTKAPFEETQLNEKSMEDTQTNHASSAGNRSKRILVVPTRHEPVAGPSHRPPEPHVEPEQNVPRQGHAKIYLQTPRLPNESDKDFKERTFRMMAKEKENSFPTYEFVRELSLRSPLDNTMWDYYVDKDGVVTFKGYSLPKPYSVNLLNIPEDFHLMINMDAWVIDELLGALPGDTSEAVRRGLKELKIDTRTVGQFFYSHGEYKAVNDYLRALVGAPKNSCVICSLIKIFPKEKPLYTPIADKTNRRRHYRRFHDIDLNRCGECLEVFTMKSVLEEHTVALNHWTTKSLKQADKFVNKIEAKRSLQQRAVELKKSADEALREDALARTKRRNNNGEKEEQGVRPANET